MYFLLKMVIYQPAMFVYQRVACRKTIGEGSWSNRELPCSILKYRVGAPWRKWTSRRCSTFGKEMKARISPDSGDVTTLNLENSKEGAWTHSIKEMVSPLSSAVTHAKGPLKKIARKIHSICIDAIPTWKMKIIPFSASTSLLEGDARVLRHRKKTPPTQNLFLPL